MRLGQREPLTEQVTRPEVRPRRFDRVVSLVVEPVLLGLTPVLQPVEPLLFGVCSVTTAAVLPCRVTFGLAKVPVGLHRVADRELTADCEHGQPMQGLGDGAVPVVAIAQPHLASVYQATCRSVRASARRDAFGAVVRSVKSALAAD